MAILPAYSLMLGFLALLGFMALAAHLKPVGGTKGYPDTNTIVPWLFHNMFPNWFAGIAFGAIAVSALVPAALMAIAAANTFTRDICKPYFRQQATDREEAFVSKLVSFIIKFGALGVLIGLNLFALEFRLIGGVVIIQILPALVLGLYTRWYHRWSLVAGWIVGVGLSVYMLYVTSSKTSAHFGRASFAFKTWGFDTKVTTWTGIVGLIANLIVATVLNPLFRRLLHGHDKTTPADYEVEGPAEPLAVAPEQAHCAR